MEEKEEYEWKSTDTKDPKSTIVTDILKTNLSIKEQLELRFNYINATTNGLSFDTSNNFIKTGSLSIKDKVASVLTTYTYAVGEKEFGNLGTKEFPLYSDVATEEEKESGFYDKYYDPEDESVLLQKYVHGNK